jgi:hypothetical protein
MVRIVGSIQRLTGNTNFLFGKRGLCDLTLNPSQLGIRLDRAHERLDITLFVSGTAHRGLAARRIWAW